MLRRKRLNWSDQGGRESLGSRHLGWNPSSQESEHMTMAATTSKHKTVQQLFNAMGKHVKTKPVEPRPVLEQFVYAILRENSTRETADQAFQSLRDNFFDWNEVRVSSTLELVEA